MHCRNCGKEVNEKAVACTSCGLPPLLETKFCQECGVETNEKQIVCVKCGCSLGKGQAHHQSKEKSDYDGFYCSSDDKVILGVCGGLAHKFGISTIIVRIAALFIPGWPLYFIGFVLPKLPTKNL